MAARAALAAIFLASLVAACTRTPNSTDVALVAAEAPSVLARSGQTGDVPRPQWPAGLAKLGPERVYVTPDGLYVVLSTQFVEERGLFVPRSAAFSTSAGTDPSYTPLGQGVFSYRLKG